MLYLVILLCYVIVRQAVKSRIMLHTSRMLIAISSQEGEVAVKDLFCGVLEASAETLSDDENTLVTSSKFKTFGVYRLLFLDHDRAHKTCWQDYPTTTYTARHQETIIEAANTLLKERTNA